MAMLVKFIFVFGGIIGNGVVNEGSGSEEEGGEVPAVDDERGNAPVVAKAGETEGGKVPRAVDEGTEVVEEEG